MSVTLYLAASASAEIFYLRSTSDPGVLVTAAVGSGMPQVVNPTDTLFALNPF